MTMKDMILIIEDDKDIAAIEKDYMEINGYGAVIGCLTTFDTITRLFP